MTRLDISVWSRHEIQLINIGVINLDLTLCCVHLLFIVISVLLWEVDFCQIVGG